MGWFSDNAPGHEGYVVGLVLDRERGLARNEYWRELSPSDEQLGRIPVRRIQVGCDCGWRSRVIVAPYGTTWVPCCVFFALDADDELAGALWSEHAETERFARLLGVPDGQHSFLQEAARVALVRQRLIATHALGAARVGSEGGR